VSVRGGGGWVLGRGWGGGGGWGGGRGVGGGGGGGRWGWMSGGVGGGGGGWDGGGVGALRPSFVGFVSLNTLRITLLVYDIHCREDKGNREWPDPGGGKGSVSSQEQLKTGA